MMKCGTTILEADFFFKLKKKTHYFERQRNRKTETDRWKITSTGSFPKCLKELGQGQVQIQSQELKPGLTGGRDSVP